MENFDDDKILIGAGNIVEARSTASRCWFSEYPLSVWQTFHQIIFWLLSNPICAIVYDDLIGSDYCKHPGQHWLLRESWAPGPSVEYRYPWFSFLNCKCLLLSIRSMMIFKSKLHYSNWDSQWNHSIQEVWPLNSHTCKTNF